MAYAVENDLNLDATRIIELTDSAAAPGVKDAVLLARLEAEAEAIVNAIIGNSVGAVPVPFVAPIPPIITFCTAAIWAYRIYRHREVMDIPSTVKDDYAMAMDMLKQISAGTIVIGPVTSDMSGVPSVESSPPRGWTDRDLVT